MISTIVVVGVNAWIDPYLQWCHNKSVDENEGGRHVAPLRRQNSSSYNGYISTYPNAQNNLVRDINALNIVANLTFRLLL